MDRPVIVQSDWTVLLEVDHPDYEAARDALLTCAELIKSPEHVHTYRLTPLSLWNAASAGLTPETVLDHLERYSRYPLAQNLVREIHETMSRFGKIRLIAHDGAYALEFLDSFLALELTRHPKVKPCIEAPVSDRLFLLKPYARGWVKQILIKLGHPVDDVAGYVPGAALHLVLRPTLLSSGTPFALRDYQVGAVRSFVGSAQAVSGNGTVVLPCGAGKTVVGLAALAQLGMHTLILVTSTVAARQWRDELIDKTTLSPEDVGEYTGLKKEVRPVTLATYQILTHRKRRRRKEEGIHSSSPQPPPSLGSETPALTSPFAPAAGPSRTHQPTGGGHWTEQQPWTRPEGVPPTAELLEEYPHFELFNLGQWGLIIYDEVHLLPAPVFRMTADIQARRRLGLTATLIREDGLEDEVFSLIGPKKYDLPWKELEAQGWIAKALCTEIRLPMPGALRTVYAVADERAKFRLASENIDKVPLTERLLQKHADDAVLIIGNYLDQLQKLADLLKLPFISGKTPVGEREALFHQFRRGEVKRLVLSKVGNFSIDLPDANVLIQVAGTFGSRQEEAQRLGRILRPKSQGSPAYFYTLVTRQTREQDFAAKRQLFLCEQGYVYRLVNADRLN